MGGGGSHGSGTVAYAPEIINRWSDYYDKVVSHNVERAGVYGVDFVSGDGNLRPGYMTLHIDPENWYGNFTTTSSDALATFKALDPKALFVAFADPYSGVRIDYTRINQLRAWLDSLWNEIGDDAASDNIKANLVSAFATRMADRIERDVIPKLEVGMRNTNAVLSSAIIMAKVAVWDGYNKEVNDYSAKVDFEILSKKYSLLEALARLEPAFFQAAAQSYEVALRRVDQYLEHAKIGMATTLSMNDEWWTKYVKARTIYIEDQIRDATWYLDMGDYLAKAISALPGGAVINPKGSINAAASTVSGATTGAAAGALAGAKIGGTTGGYWGLAIGAVVGGVAGYLQSQ